MAGEQSDQYFAKPGGPAATIAALNDELLGLAAGSDAQVAIEAEKALDMLLEAYTPIQRRVGELGEYNAWLQLCEERINVAAHPELPPLSLTGVVTTTDEPRLPQFSYLPAALQARLAVALQAIVVYEGQLASLRLSFIARLRALRVLYGNRGWQLPTFRDGHLLSTLEIE